LGAVLSGCSESTVREIENYGHCVGLSFQITDDVLDFAGDVSETGKRVGTDLRDGTVTLPLIMALEQDPSLAKLFEKEQTDDLIDELVTRVRQSGGLDKAQIKASEHVEEAIGILATVSHELDTLPLRLIAEMTVQRKV